jgi:hypothetical protein
MERRVGNAPLAATVIAIAATAAVRCKCLVRRFRAKSQRRRQAYLANLATMSKVERRELEWLEESLKPGSKGPGLGARRVFCA